MLIRNVRAVRAMALLLLVFAAQGPSSVAQSGGRAALETFLQWKSEPANSALTFAAALSKYRRKLIDEGASAPAADRMMRIIEAHYEAELYDRVYAAPPEFETRPSRLLVEALEGVPPGTALDVGMGQGRNAVYLASKGWDVTGFDVSRVGLRKANEHAGAAGVTITAVHASDEEFDFGRDRWDAIAILYALEKRSVHRVRDALKPGGFVIIESGHAETSGELGYGTNELLEIFKGFRIVKYEDRLGTYEWSGKQRRLVRLVAQKP